MANAFTNFGATPYKLPTLTGQNSFLNSYNSSTPQGKALNNVQNTPQIAPTTPPAPTGAISKTKTTGADGTSHEVHYDNTQPTSSGMVSGGLTGDQMKANLMKSGYTYDSSGKLQNPGILNSSGGTTGTTPPPPPTDTSGSDPTKMIDTPTDTTTAELLQKISDLSSQITKMGAGNYQTANKNQTNAIAGNQQYQDQATAIANAAGQKMSDIGGQGARGEAGYLTTGTSPVGEGNAAVLAQTTAAQQQAVAQGANMQLQGTAQGLIGQNQQQTGYNQQSGNAINAQGQGLTGLNNATGYAQPIQVPYSNQLIDPRTGQPMGGGQAGQLPQAATDYINSLAQQVKNGYMTRADAESRISQYSQPGLQALNTALGSGFNTNASNASAGTTATGQQIQTAADSTNKALDTLSNAFTVLSGFETGGIPATNSIAQWIGTQFGDSALQTYKTNLADARSQLIGVLNSSGGTPTGNEATANQYLPDNMTKAQFDANVGTMQNPGIVRQLIAQKVSSFTGSGSQNNNTSNSGSGIFNW